MPHPVRTGARWIAVASVVVAAACASSGGGGSSPTPRDESTFIPGAGSMTITGGAAPNVKILMASLDQVWRVMPSAYDSLKIPLSVIDPRTHTLGNEGFKLRQRLGPTRLSTFLECGTTQVGPNADSYEVYMSILTKVEAVTGTQTRVTTTIIAQAKPLVYAQDYSRCSTKDALEAKIAAVITAKLAK